MNTTELIPTSFGTGKLACELTPNQELMVSRLVQIAIGTRNAVEILTFPNQFNETPEEIEALLQRAFRLTQYDIEQIEHLLV